LAEIRSEENLMRPFLPVLSFAIAAALAAPALADPLPPSSVAVNGKGEVVTAPDTAFVNAGVTTTAATARDALNANTKSMADLIATLKTAGVDAKDIQTSDFSVNPQYVYPDKDADGNTPPPRITGYQVQNGVNVEVRKLVDLGGILDKIVTVGANTINGVSFSVDDTSKLLEEARKAAFADAKSKAQTYADAADVSLGNILSISEEQSQDAPQPHMFKAMAMAAPAPVPVEAGQLTYDVDVSVSWELKNKP
jgi:uncharacterized protein YggE